MTFPSDAEWVRIAPDIARKILGEPTKSTTKELRWGRQGSKCLDLETGRYYDHELGDGGGVVELIKLNGYQVKDFLKILEE